MRAAQAAARTCTRRGPLAGAFGFRLRPAPAGLSWTSPSAGNPDKCKASNPTIAESTRKARGKHILTVLKPFDRFNRCVRSIELDCERLSVCMQRRIALSLAMWDCTDLSSSARSCERICTTDVWRTRGACHPLSDSIAPKTGSSWLWQSATSESLSSACARTSSRRSDGGWPKTEAFHRRSASARSCNRDCTHGCDRTEQRQRVVSAVLQRSTATVGYTGNAFTLRETEFLLASFALAFGVEYYFRRATSGLANLQRSKLVLCDFARLLSDFGRIDREKGDDFRLEQFEPLLERRQRALRPLLVLRLDFSDLRIQFLNGFSCA